MNCLEFVDRLGSLAAGTCPPGERDAAERHAARCPVCGDLLRDARMGPLASVPMAEEQAGDEDGSLVGLVLERTAGSACGRAEELLCRLAFEREDETVQPHERVLLDAHLEHCVACTRLAEALNLASHALPTLAAFDPGPAFTRAVLDATNRAAGRSRVASVTTWWRLWMARPRFALEVAYVATLLVVLLVGNPIAQLQAASARTVTVAAARLERARTALSPALPVLLRVPPSAEALSVVRSEVLEQKTALGAIVDTVATQAERFWSSAWAWLRATTSDVVAALRTAWANLAASGRGDTEPTRPGGR